jgi:urea transport system permease protein
MKVVGCKSIFKRYYLAFVVFILAIFPLFTDSYNIGLLSRFLVFAVAALSLEMFWYSGVASFGHAVFFGLGSYAMGLTLKYLSIYLSVGSATLLGFLLAIIVPVAVGFLIGYFLFYGRVTGVYFGIVTMALSLICQKLVIASINFTGGLNGLSGYPRPRLGIPGLFEIEIKGDLVPYYLILIGLSIVFLLSKKVLRSPFGLMVQAIRNNEQRLETFGFNVPKGKVLILVISSAIGGLAGALYVPVGFITHDLLGISFSTQILVWVCVGGRGTLIGPILGTLVVNYLQVYLSGVMSDLWLLIIGIFFIAVIMFKPDGIMGFFPQQKRVNGIDQGK